MDKNKMNNMQFEPLELESSSTHTVAKGVAEQIQDVQGL